ncbi:protein kinase domain-containing protein [Pendulispora albinea]|uniref:Serine/threonine protein kinase n=1 Tax=Pendulispora albinea TaxID=2741071 RepID=A0ABZ2LIV3_9BACT
MPAPFTRQSVSERALARVGTTVQGKYRIDRLIGIGGTAAVYAATHRNGHRVAIKFLLDHLLDDTDMYHLFSREAYVANRIGHPGAVPVLDDDEDDDGCVFLIMPLVEGETLRARWERADKHLPFAEAGVLIADALDVLATAHAKGVVHRDIKPENLFVNTAAQVRVLDFGIARRTGTESTLTMTGRFIGTPAFMPPEQALGNRYAIGPQSDLWAVGATMFSLLSGETVHLAEHSGAQLAAAATQRARSIATLVPDLHPALVHVIDKALQFEPAERWSSAGAMREALLAALEQALEERSDVTAARVRDEIVAEFAAKAAERAAANGGNGDAQEPDLRSGPARKTPRTAAAVHDDTVAPTPVDYDSPMGGSERRGDEVGSGRRHASGGGATRGPDDTHISGSDEEPRSPVRDDLVSTQPEAMLPDVPGLETDTPIARRRSWFSRAVTWVAVVALAGITGAGAMRRCGGALGDGMGTTASIAGASKNSDAQASLDAGIQLWRDASTGAARNKFAEAARIDPGLAVAHLYFVATSEWLDPDVRPHFTEARALRSRLSPSQAALFDALEPMMQEPPDHTETTRRLEALTNKFPNDAISWTVRGAHDLRTKDPERLLSIVHHIDGALAFWFRGRAEILKGDVAAGRRSLQSCISASSQGGMDCLVWLARLEANEGSCEESALAARRMISIDHTAPDGYRFLARAEYGRSHRTSAVRAILEGRWARLPEAKREIEHQRDEFDLAVLDGQFDRAYAALAAWEKAAISSVNAYDRVVPFISRIDLALELGQNEPAQQAARDFIEASQTWLPYDTWDMPTERTRALYLTGIIDRNEFRRRRAHDEEGLLARGGYYAAPGVRWWDAYVQIIKDTEDSRFAIEHQPKGAITDAEFFDLAADAQLGRMYLDVDQVDKALQSLGRAVKSCVYWKAIHGVRAHALYADALAASGRPRDACEHYAYTLERWRDPRSLTARAARESAVRNGCPGVTGGSYPNVVKGVSK